MPLKKYKIKRYGWVVDVPDIRDVYRIAKPTTVAALPDKVDLRDGFPDCYDQGDLGSCTANAIGAAIEFDQRKQKLTEFIPSRLFIYYNERVVENTVSEDAGAQIRDGIKIVNSLGVPPEKYWPYLIERFTRKPSKSAFTKAKAHKPVSYKRLPQEVDQLRSCLADGFPFVFGFTVYDKFESDNTAQTGKVYLPTKDEAILGGHAVCCVGYDAPAEEWLVRNSWGTDWGQHGYFTMPFEYLIDRNLSDDFWTIRQVT